VFVLNFCRITVPPCFAAATLGVNAVDALITGEWKQYVIAVNDWARRKGINEEFVPPVAHVFWRGKLPQWPSLAKAALRALAVPFSVAEAERDFSTLHRIQADNRLAMGDDYLASELFCAGNHHLSD
jgi:hypothetical protein